MKKLLSLVLFAALALSLSLTALAAAPQNLVYDRDATLSASFVKYGSITVKPGVTLTIDKSSGFEIAGNITVEPGGRIICNGIGSGDFNFVLCSPDTVVTGMELYFRYRTETGTELRCVSGGFAAIAAMDCWDFAGGWRPSFKWEPAVQGWCLTGDTNVNLSNEPAYHTARDMEIADRFAGSLNQLRLFRGSDTGYELSREGSRLEAMVMLIRLLGKEDAALSGTWTHPFTDVPVWAESYVGYAYETGLTMGVSATEFGTGAASAQMYYTFLLRALGMNETEGFSVYDNAFALIEASGIASTENDPYELCARSFWRADMVVASYRALSAVTASGEQLSRKLIADGVFTDEEYRSATR